MKLLFLFYYRTYRFFRNAYANHTTNIRMSQGPGVLIIFYTGCPINWYPLLISIPDFCDGPKNTAD